MKANRRELRRLIAKTAIIAEIERQNQEQLPKHHKATAIVKEEGPIPEWEGACDSSSYARWVEGTGYAGIAGEPGLTGGFILRSTKKARTAAIKSKTMAILNTPPQPQLGMVILPPNGNQTVEITVRMSP